MWISCNGMYIKIKWTTEQNSRKERNITRSGGGEITGILTTPDQPSILVGDLEEAERCLMCEQTLARSQLRTTHTVEMARQRSQMVLSNLQHPSPLSSDGPWCRLTSAAGDGAGRCCRSVSLMQRVLVPAELSCKCWRPDLLPLMFVLLHLIAATRWLLHL